jgi:hypothetical protein
LILAIHPKVAGAALTGALLVLALTAAFVVPEPLALAFRLPWTIFETEGSVEAIGVAAVAALMYWLVLPKDWRMAGLLLISLFMPLIIGGSAAFVLLIAALALMTHTAARQPAETFTTAAPAQLGFLFVIFSRSCLVLPP